MAKVTPSCRVALKNDSYTLHKILPNKVKKLNKKFLFFMEYFRLIHLLV